MSRHLDVRVCTPLSTSTTGEFIYSTSGPGITILRRRVSNGVQPCRESSTFVCRYGVIRNHWSILLWPHCLESVTKEDEGHTSERIFTTFLSAGLCVGISLCQLVNQSLARPFPSPMLSPSVDLSTQHHHPFPMRERKLAHKSGKSDLVLGFDVVRLNVLKLFHVGTDKR